MRLRYMFIVFLFFLLTNYTYAQDDEECLDCHDDAELVTERREKQASVYVNQRILQHSIHNEKNCVDCHINMDFDLHPDEDEVQPVFCGECHEDVQSEYDGGIHGKALVSKQLYAPDCAECHGKHDILSTEDPKSPSYKMNIPFLCGKCHKEGAPVARVYDITEHNILENYSLSIHGEGLFKKGLIVTAACVDCHNSHFILPHTESRSSISPRNVAQTCMKCHSRIEDVHQKVIEGEKWEEAPGSIPTCTDCHTPHKARKESMTLTLSDRSCLKCHEKTDVHKTVNGEKISLLVSKEDLKESTHREVTCVKCHSDVDPRLKRPCKTAGMVDCASCHIKMGEEYLISGHGQAYGGGVKNAPTCTTCHGEHIIKSSVDENSPTYRAEIPRLCGDCHREDNKIEETKNLAETNAFLDYSKSVHGKSLEEKGLLPSAICTDCHSTHMVLNHEDSRSSVYVRNIPATCASCHRGVYKDFIKSIHFSIDERKLEELPACTSCHSAHKIGEVKKDQFMTEVTEQCGSCHEDLSMTYLETMHGKAYILGNLESAKCSDCHSSHNILSITDPRSSISNENIVETCKQCHKGATEKFTAYLTHATHHDPKKYPALYYTYLVMTTLLVGVFSFFGIHTLLWLPRSLRQLMKRKRKKEIHSQSRYYIRRFDLAHRITHLFVILSFMSLALTGMIVKFSFMDWAGFLSDFIGGVKVAGTIHRIAAVMTFGYFVSHLVILFKRKKKTKQSLKKFIFGPDSMMFNLKDFKDFWVTLKWFVGAGPRPQYGRWTYWEKFDYFAVFWGVFIIGMSGLMLWFPEYFTYWVPGWFINIATIIHSDEALLAVGFIFTIHFFNTHLRPEAFPMDKVIFSGLVPLDEYKKDRPHEYEQLKKSGRLRKMVVKDNVPRALDRVFTFFGFLFLALGITLIVLIIYSVLSRYL